MYRECCEGNIESTWKREPVSYFEFREQLSQQMLQYSPANKKYPGDDKMRVNTKVEIRKRKQKTDNGGLIDQTQFSKAKRFKGSRLCGDLDKLTHHASNIIRLSDKARICAWCGLSTWTTCGICKATNGKDVPLHYNPKSSS
jgi:hypothetical protein